MTDEEKIQKIAEMIEPQLWSMTGKQIEQTDHNTRFRILAARNRHLEAAKQIYNFILQQQAE